MHRSPAECRGAASDAGTGPAGVGRHAGAFHCDVRQRRHGQQFGQMRERGCILEPATLAASDPPMVSGKGEAVRLLD
jgi:hypothetical protein